MEGYWKKALQMASLLLIAGTVYLLMSSSPKQPDDRAQKFDQEPEVSVYFHRTGKTETMPIEEYIMGVVAGEMKPNWPKEAYAAQAILARSFTMHYMSQGGAKDKYGTDVTTNEEEAQAYNADNITPTIEEAVNSTRGQVMTFNDRYVRAWFHSYSGGITATAKEGLNYPEPEPAYIKSVRIPTNEYAPEDVKSWTTEIDLVTLQEKLADAGVSGPIEDVKIKEKGNTGRVTAVEVTHSNGKKTTIPGNDFRIAVGAMEMKSALVNEFRVQDGKLMIAGKGFGHGVGLSQWDAYKLAKDGYTPQEIVDFFFKDIEIKKLWD
ncbi:MAG: SpoIID/LytB domain-containing protein [Limnochordia bacterium]|jgi:stage II sporulation protein D|nr:SpoIID/LytB domain-containing protein [Limnochordia bacterium]MDD2629125.1 SpoIID/LytB domain-containing protein [Limnochordia bacterium]MDD4517819.1 SpoIID/LytB domain-containing protein [Limnochordia bacterium]